MTELTVLDDPAAALAEMLADAAEAGGHVVLAGGSSYKRAYELAAARDSDWSRTTVWYGDERCVPPDHELSNHAMAQAALLSRLQAPPEVVRMQGELGPDAHTASLFPGKPEVEERSRLVVGVELAGMEPQVPRISLSLPALNSGRRTVFLVTGADKAKAVARAFGDTPDGDSPAAHVRPRAGQLLVFCDPAAAKELV